MRNAILTLLLFGMLAAHANPAAFYEGLTMARLRGSAVGPELWTPADLTNTFTAWHDASLLPGSGTVSNWPDVSGNNRHLVQSTEAARPTLTTLNSLPSLSFDGTNDVMTSANYGSSLAQPKWFFAAFSLPVDAVVAADLMSSSTGDRMLFRPNWTGPNALVFAGAVGPTPARLTQGSYIVGTFFSRTNSFASINGTTGAVADAGSWGISGLRVARADDSETYLSVNFGEAMVIDGAMVATDRQKLEGYLAHKWGLTGNLPADHPWKSSTPTK
jgi:hypothetical protein